MVKCLTHGLRGFNGAVQRRLATLTVTILISSYWQLSSEVELRRIFDVCKRWTNWGSHELVKKNMVRYMRPHGRFTHCSCKNAVRQPPLLASCIEIYYSLFTYSVYCCCRSTGISLGMNPKPYRQYLTFGQVYRLIEFLNIVWGTSPNFRFVLRLVCCWAIIRKLI